MLKVATKRCRYGVMSFFDGSDYIGVSLNQYGEYSQQEVVVLEKCLKPGDTCIDVGANIGAFTIPMSKFVGPTGRVIAFEPGADAARLLRSNVADNLCRNVEVYEAAASSSSGTIRVQNEGTALGCVLTDDDEGNVIVKKMAIDELKLQRVSFIKIDVDGHEKEVLRGARETIMRDRPIIYCENDRAQKSVDLIAEFVSLGYRLYWHRTPLFNPQNFFGNKRNLFGRTISIMMVCVPEEVDYVVEHCDEVADIRPDDQMFDREIERYTRYLERKPDDLNLRVTIAHLQNMMQREDLAFAAIEENLRRDPKHLKTLGLRGLLMLQRGNFKEGWPAYELRFQGDHPQQFGGHRTHPVPKWAGQATDEPVLIWCEQGYGDVIMYARFMPEVLRRAPRAMLEVQPQLYELFEQSRIVPPGQLFRLGRTLPPYALHCSLPSVAAVLDVGPDEIKTEEPYLFADPMVAANWQGTGNYSLAPLANSKSFTPLDSIRIAICYKGSVRSERPYTRDIPAELFQPLMQQYGPFLDLSLDGQFESFADTAAAISGLDLVITVDTAVAHLAGAMGMPTWLLLSYDPDWRWGLKGDSTIWYPTMRIFRQPRFRDWDSVLSAVVLALNARSLTKAA